MVTSPDSTGSGPDARQPPVVPAPPSRKPWIRYLVITVFVGLVLAPLFFWGIRGEIGRWHEAAFWNAKFAGDMELAMEQLDQAIARSPERSDLLSQRAELLMRTGDYASALAIADRLVDQVRQQQQMKPGETLMRRKLARQLNMRGYYRAVANQENAKGLVDIQEAFELMGDETDWTMRDTRAFLYYRLGDYDSAITDIDYALPLTRRSIMGEIASLQRLIRSGSPAIADRPQMDYLRQSLREGLGVVHQHRGLILEQLGRKKAARRDFALARQYGFDAQKGSL